MAPKLRVASKAIARADGLANVLTGLMQDQDWRQSTTIAFTPRLSFSQLNELYRTNHLIARIVDEPSDDATRRWFRLEGMEDTDASKAVMDKLEDLGAQEIFARALKRDRKDGGALILMQVNDGQQDLSKPIDEARITDITGLHLLDRWYAIADPTFDPDPTSEYFQQPLYYTLGRESQIRVHASRVLTFRGIEISDLTIRETAGWGESVIDRVWLAVRRYLHLWDYIEATSKHFSQTVLKMSGLADLIAGGREDAVRARMTLFQRFRSAFKAVPIDAEDDLAETAVQYQGAAQLLAEAKDDVASAAGMPVTKLFGHAPGGLSTDDDSGRRNWADTVATLQRRKLLNPLNELCEIILMSKLGPTSGVMPDRYQISFLPLTEPTDDELAARRLKEAQADGILAQTGILSPSEIRTRFENDPHSPYQLDAEPPTPPTPSPNTGAQQIP